MIALNNGVLVYRYLLEIQKTAQPEPLAEVVVARVRIPSGARITQDMVKTSQLPAKYVHPMAINDRKDAVNQYAGVDILPDQAVLTGHLVTESNVKELPFKIPEGYRAITVAVNPVSGVGGHVKPGHYVDILVACKETPNSEDVTVVTLLQNVLVLATGPELDKKDEIHT